MIGFTTRNLKVFFKDKTTVFFSLLSVFIVLALYVIFLGESLGGGIGQLEGARLLMDSWLISGILTITSITTAMGAFGIMISDRANKISKDFVSSPTKNSTIVAGYISSAVIIGVIMSILSLVISQIYTVVKGGELLTLIELGKVLLLVVLTTITNVSIVLFVVTLIKSESAFATATTVIGTLIGFITGVYVPIGELPDAVQTFVKCFPVSHAGALFRQVLTKTPMETTFAGAPPASVLEFEESMGIVFRFDDYLVSPFESVMVLVLTAIVFYGLSVLSLNRKER